MRPGAVCDVVVGWLGVISGPVPSSPLREGTVRVRCGSPVRLSNKSWWPHLKPLTKRGGGPALNRNNLFPGTKKRLFLQGYGKRMCPKPSRECWRGLLKRPPRRGWPPWQTAFKVWRASRGRSTPPRAAPPRSVPTRDAPGPAPRPREPRARAHTAAKNSYPDSYPCYLNSYSDSTGYLEAIWGLDSSRG